MDIKKELDELEEAENVIKKKFTIFLKHVGVADADNFFNDNFVFDGNAPGLWTSRHMGEGQEYSHDWLYRAVRKQLHAKLTLDAMASCFRNAIKNQGLGKTKK